MSVLRPPAALVAAAFLVATACDDPAEPAPLGGNAVLEQGVLTVRGDDAGSEIAVRYSGSGIDVERDGDAARFTDPVTAIEVVGGPGPDVIRYDQTVVADLALTIAAGEGDDEVAVSFAPTGSGAEMTLAAELRTGAGSDSLDVRWDGTAVPALNPYVTLAGETEGALDPLAEADDEVLVAFEHGDPDRPVVLGVAWSATGAVDTLAGPDTSRVALTLDFREGKADTEIDVSGDYRRMTFDARADYSGVRLQQGRVAVDADMDEGDNRAGTYIVTSPAHTVVDVRVTGGDGNNVVEIEDILGGDGERTYAIDLGDGDNRTSIRFGDGVRGARPATGTRTVDASYRSGAGASGVVVTSEVVEPLVSDVTLDYGTGQGDTQGRYKVRLPWDRSAGSGGLEADFGARLAVASPGGSALDLRVEVGDPEVDDPATFGVVTAAGSQVNESDLAFLRRLAENANGALEDEWEVRVGGLAVADSGSLAIDAPAALERLVYLQSSVAVGDGAAVDVTLSGAAATLAHLIGIAGAGRYDFAADGQAAGLRAVLTRDLLATGAGFGFTLAGGPGNDVLGLDRPGTASASNAPITHALAGGAGTDACYAPQDVAVTGCEQLDAIGETLIGQIEATFGAALADVWR